MVTSRHAESWLSSIQRNTSMRVVMEWVVVKEARGGLAGWLGWLMTNKPALPNVASGYT